MNTMTDDSHASSLPRAAPWAASDGYHGTGRNVRLAPRDSATRPPARAPLPPCFGSRGTSVETALLRSILTCSLVPSALGETSPRHRLLGIYRAAMVKRHVTAARTLTLPPLLSGLDPSSPRGWIAGKVSLGAGSVPALGVSLGSGSAPVPPSAPRSAPLGTQQLQGLWAISSPSPRGSAVLRENPRPWMRPCYPTHPPKGRQQEPSFSPQTLAPSYIAAPGSWVVPPDLALPKHSAGPVSLCGHTPEESLALASFLQTAEERGRQHLLPGGLLPAGLPRRLCAHAHIARSQAAGASPAQRFGFRLRLLSARSSRKASPQHSRAAH